ncbi:Aste57867_20863 [Aphanomyces stellatus]|uniref:Aste57867_20863 protein n=1 Tax=Aphanomyces stellatus TaxID=120398 RepID=A0A485LGR5_9STRA|nr:hypothetical protein As57867_020795 [Aphanomyces stellatus]VFT97540.1 Aste57867_20863 [Aphanomyces stellatus]
MNGLVGDGDASNYTEMEGNLHVRAKNMNVWKKRRFVLSGQVLQYFSLKKPQKGMLEAFAGLALPAKKREDHVFELVQSSIKTVHEYLSSRSHSFQISSPSFFLLLHADSQDEMTQWVIRLRHAAQHSSPRIDRVLQRIGSPSYHSSNSLLSPSSAMIKVAAQSREDDIQEFHVMQKTDLHNVTSNCRCASERLLVKYAIYLQGKQLPRGSVLLAINGTPVAQPAQSTLRHLLYGTPLPAVLQFLRCRPKVGVLKSQSYEALGSMLKITTRGTAIMGWKDLACEIDGGDFVCARFLPPSASATATSLAKWVLPESMGLMPSAAAAPTTQDRSTATKTAMALDGATVRLVHEVLSGRPCCFLLSNATTSLLLQASSEDEMVDWMGALVHAIDVANGVLVGSDKSIDESDDTSSTSFFPHATGIARHLHTTQEALLFGLSSSSSPAAVLDQPELVRILTFCQQEGRYTEALQMLGQYTTLRAQYWPHIFAWALPPAVDAAAVAELATRPISDEDRTQVDKDIPRTAGWLASSDGAPPKTVHAPPDRLDALRGILHAFIASSSPQMAYLQGLNGIAFVLLEVFNDDTARAFGFLHGLVHGVLPSIFQSAASTSSACSSPNALVQTGAQLESMVLAYLPALSTTFEHVGLPVFLLAYKWFPTLFSDVSLQANRKHNQLRYETLLLAWDVCMLLGVEGIYCVALALFAAADHAIRALGRPLLAEDVSGAFTTVLANLSPDDLVVHVCEVMETCQHPLLLQMRESHHRCLHVPLTVKNLDTGQLFGVGANATLVPLCDGNVSVQ